MKHEIVVVPWDFSNHANAALQFAFKNYESQDIRVVCVLEQPNPYAFGCNWGPNAEENARVQCTNKFFETVGVTKDTGAQFFVRFGDPAAQIIRFTKHQEADLIVMSTHGRTGISRLVMGSVAQKVVTRAACPVIILPNRWLNKEAGLSSDHVEKRVAGS